VGRFRARLYLAGLGVLAIVGGTLAITGSSTSERIDLLAVVAILGGIATILAALLFGADGQ
jgi:hypothetical protein